MNAHFQVGQVVGFRHRIATVVAVNATSVDLAYQGKTEEIRERITPSGYQRIKVLDA